MIVSTMTVHNVKGVESDVISRVSKTKSVFLVHFFNNQKTSYFNKNNAIAHITVPPMSISHGSSNKLVLVTLLSICLPYRFIPCK